MAREDDTDTQEIPVVDQRVRKDRRERPIRPIPPRGTNTGGVLAAVAVVAVTGLAISQCTGPGNGDEIKLGQNSEGATFSILLDDENQRVWASVNGESYGSASIVDAASFNILNGPDLDYLHINNRTILAFAPGEECSAIAVHIIRNVDGSWERYPTAIENLPAYIEGPNLGDHWTDARRHEALVSGNVAEQCLTRGLTN